MSLMFEPFRKYATFKGRARRKEYWLFALFITLVMTGLTIALLAALVPIATAESLEAQIANGGLVTVAAIALVLFYLATLLPSLAVMVRRLHDTGNSGWWALLNIIPGGTFVLFIFALIDGTAGPNRYGADPKGREAERY